MVSLLTTQQAANRLRMGIKAFVETASLQWVPNALVVVDGVALWNAEIVDKLPKLPPRQRTNPKRRTSRSDLPVVRVRSAVTRLSRETWIPPRDLNRIVLALARCAAPGSPWLVCKFAFPHEAEYVGVIDGRPVLSLKDERFQALKDAAKSKAMKKKSRGENELFLLKFLSTERAIK